MALFERSPLLVIRQLLRDCVVRVARRLGSDLRDEVTGEMLGRALLLTWRGRILVIGLDVPVRLHFLPQRRLTYWKQEIGFTAAPVPNFPHEPRP